MGKSHILLFVKYSKSNSVISPAFLSVIGIKRAVALFEDKGYTWKTVVDAFAEKDLSEDIALQNARLAKILTTNDYDWRAKQPILFTPSSDYRVDSGTGLQDKKT